ncbi:unnamed protein product [Eruca vesicaria subsp. sativa]|uniref:Uncharacterized protein n=1 Tax=Eruca vesicaria subsp. sativa TaxID=29727 RepID=A0ABC8J3F1_ERUVS|nr:unnamed protein product [Eruca vesicaria subsp. sativa]
MATLEFQGLQAAQAEEKDDGERKMRRRSCWFFQRTKSGKELPKAYLKSAREVVKTMRDSLKKTQKTMPNLEDAPIPSRNRFLILSNWRGQKSVAGELMSEDERNHLICVQDAKT